MFILKKDKGTRSWGRGAAGRAVSGERAAGGGRGAVVEQYGAQSAARRGAVNPVRRDGGWRGASRQRRQRGRAGGAAAGEAGRRAGRSDQRASESRGEPGGVCVVKLYNSEGGQENTGSGRTSKRVIGWRRGHRVGPEQGSWIV
ncbi:hypothetical protein B0H13DRAFT_1906172 [Mycena leptocephala]|nr:hypothetical protein B0H13DRAFT_1906172 [Mycena leptocephala]